MEDLVKALKELVREGYKLKAQHGNPKWNDALVQAEEILLAHKKDKSNNDIKKLVMGRVVYHLTEENKGIFFMQPEINVRSVFTVPDSLRNQVHELALMAGLIIEDYDPNSMAHANVASLYKISPNANNVMLTLEMTAERTATCIKRIEDSTGIRAGDTVVYTNKSDFGFLNGQPHKVLRLIPMEQMQNSSKDCAEVQLATPIIRKNERTWADMTTEEYAKWNEGKEPERHIHPDDELYYRQIVRLDNCMTMNVFNNLKKLQMDEVHELINEGQTAIRDGRFEEWFDGNIGKFKLNTK